MSSPLFLQFNISIPKWVKNVCLSYNISLARVELIILLDVNMSENIPKIFHLYSVKIIFILSLLELYYQEM